MLSKIKAFLKKFLPPPVNTFMREINRLSAEINKLSKEIEAIKKQTSEIRVIKEQSVKNYNKISETTWAEIFNSTVYDSSWLKNKTFSPGRWALGYSCLYVMYRILNEVQPKCILELGLGQSTKMIAQYASANEDVSHYVVESDPEWIDFFSHNFVLPKTSSIVNLEWEYVKYKEADSVRSFKNFENAFGDKKFDFIFIDAPMGGDMKIYSRIDVLSLIPDSLSENFVLLMDDTERSGEKNTIEEITARLDEAHVAYSKCNYNSDKKITLICDERHSFLTTM